MKRLLLALIDFYRREISPRVPPTCRFTPTCSAYAREAIERHGSWRGSLLAVWRVLRCNPFVRGGYDPVPPARGSGRAPGEEDEATEEHRQASPRDEADLMVPS